MLKNVKKIIIRRASVVSGWMRQNLSFLEEAEGYRNMMEDYGLTQEELAEKLSKSQSSIANKLRVLKLEDSVKKLLNETDRVLLDIKYTTDELYKKHAGCEMKPVLEFLDYLLCLHG